MSERIELPDVKAEAEEWAAALLGPNGTGKVQVEFDVKDGHCQGVRLGGSKSRKMILGPSK